MPQLSQQGMEVLVVEDSRTQAQRLCFLLEEWGCTVTVVHDALSALESLRRFPPSVVISDIVMPGMDGFELCSAIRGNPACSDICVVLLTMLSGPNDILRALECGADHFITKPYDETYLFGRMQNIAASLERCSDEPGDPTSVVFGGRRYRIRLDMQRALNLIVSTYDSSVLSNRRLRETQEKLAVKVAELETALHEVRTLQGVLPICMHCKKIRDDRSYWHQLERFISDHADVVFSHGICPDCAQHMYGLEVGQNQGS